jgi:hypothetical protein
LTRWAGSMAGLWDCWTSSRRATHSSPTTTAPTLRSNLVGFSRGALAARLIGGAAAPLWRVAPGSEEPAAVCTRTVMSNITR